MVIPSGPKRAEMVAPSRGTALGGFRGAPGKDSLLVVKKHLVIFSSAAAVGFNHRLHHARALRQVRHRYRLSSARVLGIPADIVHAFNAAQSINTTGPGGARGIRGHTSERGG